MVNETNLEMIIGVSFSVLQCSYGQRFSCKAVRTQQIIFRKLLNEVKNMSLFSSECANCGSKEHSTNDCPHGIFSSKCSHCGSVDHSSSQCPHGIFSEKCSICGSTEHSTKNCPHGILSSECGICGSVDHSTKNCPHGILSTECSNCGSKNHSTSDCPHGILSSRSSSNSRSNYSSQTSGENAIYGCLGKVIGYLIVAAIIIWLVFAVAIPLIIINIAIISLVVGLVQNKYKIYLFILSILAMVYLAIDYYEGYFTKTLANNVPFLDGVIPIFFYLNILAGLASAYFLIRDFLNKQNPSTEGEGEFSQRNLLIMGSLLLLGVLMIVFVKRYGFENTEIIQSSVIESTSPTSTTDQFFDTKIKEKVNEYLNRNIQPSVEYVSSLYANNVDFYNAGIVDKNFIFKDKIAYFSKWSERQYTLISNVEVTPGGEARTWIASFDYNYKVKNTKRSRQGNAWCKLIFREEGNSIVIVSEKGGLYKQ